jgi:signal transduction histidine kinase
LPLDSTIPGDETDASRGVERSRPCDARRTFRFGLSAKLLLLTAAFVMLAEVLIFVPSVANFRKNWLTERLAAAQIASLAVQAAPNNVVPNRLRNELLDRAKVHSIAVRRGAVRLLVLQTPMPRMVDAHFNLQTAGPAEMIGDALYALVSPPGRLIRVIGRPELAHDTVEIVLSEAPLKAAMYRYALNILGLSIIISLITAALVYLTLNAVLVRPVSRLIRGIVRFRENPEDAGRVIEPGGRRDEVGLAEAELACMQNELLAMLRQKSRLAALGLAVSKVNHDLRNMLSSAQLMSDRLATSRDPTVQRFAPKLIASLDRAIAFCNETLRYGRAEEAAPERRRFLLRPLVDEVGEGLGLPGHGRIRWTVDMDDSLEIDADRGQLSRILTNLTRNAVQALEAPPDILRPELAVAARREENSVVISVVDNGPGLPPRARANLFRAFQGSVRAGGTGLGLAISAELTRAHGGEIWLGEAPSGTTFHIRFPDSGTGMVDSGGGTRNFSEATLAFGGPKH